MQTLTLDWDEKARIVVATEYEDGTLVDAGRNWSWSTAPNGVAVVTGSPGGYFIEAVAGGRTEITFTAGAFSEVVDLTVTAPAAVRLAVAIGAAEPK